MSDEPKKSQIDSFGISMGKTPRHTDAPAQPAAAPRSKTVPWHVLVCSDLGYRSKTPDRVLAAEWKDFFASRHAVIAGAVALPGAEKPVWIEYPVFDINDFSQESFERKIPALTATAGVRDALSGVLKGTLTTDEACAVLDGITGAETGAFIEEARGLLRPAPAGRKPSPQKARRVDSILSALDLGDAAEKTAEPASGAMQALFDAAGAGAAPVAKEAVAPLLASVETRLRVLTDTLVKQPFFRERKTAWFCLMDLARTLGRSSDVRLSVYSGDAETCADNFGGMLDACAENDVSPDVVLWDFPVAITQAGIDRLAEVARRCERHKAMTIAPLAGHDPLNAAAVNAEGFAEAWADQRLIPLKRFRKEPEARCAALCLPPVRYSTRDGSGGEAGGAWLAVRTFVSMLLGGRPFEDTARTDRESTFYGQPAVKAPREVALEAGTVGLTVLPADTPDIGIRTLIDGETADACYTWFDYNLLINRVSRLSARMIADGGSAETVGSLRQFLLSQLEPYRILTSTDNLGVSQDAEGRLRITIDSEMQVGGSALHLEIGF